MHARPRRAPTAPVVVVLLALALPWWLSSGVGCAPRSALLPEAPAQRAWTTHAPAASIAPGAPGAPIAPGTPDTLIARTIVPGPHAAAHGAVTTVSAPPPVRHLGSIGMAAPTAFEAASSDGRWVVLCQARSDTNRDGHIAVHVGQRGELSGDRMQSYLVLGDGPGTPIDELAAYDPSGRWLVVMQHKRLVLIDTQSQNRVDLTALGADARDDALPYRQHRALSFDANGTRLLYVRRRGGTTRVVVRDLASGAESIVDPGQGRLWRAALSPDGSKVVLRMIVDDTNGDGKLEWPVPMRKLNRWRCHGPIATYNSWIARGDEPVVEIALGSGGRAKAIPGFAAPFGRSLLAHDSVGRLWLERESGDRIELSDDKCGARVLHADVERGLVLVACSAPAGRSPLRLLGVGYRQELKADLAAAPPDRWPDGSPRLVALYPGADTALLDLDEKKMTLLERRDFIVATSGSHALVRRGRRLLIRNVDTGRDQSIPGRTDKLAEARVAGHIAVVTPLVVDVASGRLLGEVHGRPLAVSTAGLVLVAGGRDAEAHRLAQGPLRWREPK